MQFNLENAFALKEFISKKAVALLPIGAVEIHGPHLPTGTDSILAEQLCQKLAQKTNAIILPTVHYTPVWSLGEFTGTISISSKLLTELLTEIMLEVHRNGFKVLALVNTHLGSLDAIKAASRNLLAQKPDFTVLTFTYPGANEIIPEIMEQAQFYGNFFHADEIETSYMLHLAPQHVNMQKAYNAVIDVPPLYEYMPMKWDKFTGDAVMGNAANASAKKGEAVIEHCLNKMLEVLGSEII